MEQVLDISGIALIEGDIVTIDSEGDLYTYRVREVQPGNVGLVVVASHGLRHNLSRRGIQLLAGSEVRRVADGPVRMSHQNGLVAFG